MKLIATSFDSYRQVVMPPDAGAVQVVECRRAFFAGAAVLQSAIIRSLSDGPDVRDSDVTFMTAIQEELESFAQELDLDVLGVSTTPPPKNG